MTQSATNAKPAACGALPPGVVLYTRADLFRLGVPRLQRGSVGVSGFPHSEDMADQVLGLRAQAMNYDEIAAVLAGNGVNRRHVYAMCAGRRARLAAICQALGRDAPPPAPKNAVTGRLVFSDATARKALDEEKRLERRRPKAANFVMVVSWLRQERRRCTDTGGGIYTIAIIKHGQDKELAAALTRAQVVKFANDLRVRQGHTPFDVTIDPISHTAETASHSCTGGSVGDFAKQGKWDL